MSRAPNAFFQMQAIPTAPLVDLQTGRITDPWYRAWLALIQRTGGTSGRETPTEAPSMFSLDSVGVGDAGGAGVGLFPALPDVPTGGDFWAAIPLPATELAPSYPPPNDAPVGVFIPPAIPSALSNPASPEAITLGASPFTFTPADRGQALLSGGTVTGVTWTRDGTTFYATGQIAGFFPLEVTDSLVITYTVLPTLTFLRGPK